MTPRREEIEAAVAAYDCTHPLTPLPRNAARLLAVMFPVCTNEARTTLRARDLAKTPCSDCALWRFATGRLRRAHLGRTVMSSG